MVVAPVTFIDRDPKGVPLGKSGMQFIDLAAQQARIKPEIDARIAAVLAHGRYILGPEVEELESRLVEFTGAPYCISCANGTDALQIALMALGIGPGDEVIVPAFSFIATAEAVALVGATPVYADILPGSFNIDPESMAAAITEKTRGVIPVSLYGQCPDMARINALADQHQLCVIEDAAQSFGAGVDGTRSCNLSQLATTSFFPAKPLGCYGDGGAVFASEESLARVVRQVARHGESARYHHERLGLNSRLDTLQAAVLHAKLDIFEDELARRDAVARRYTEALAPAIGHTLLSVPELDEGHTSAWAQYTLRLRDREQVQAALGERGIPTAIHYPVPLHHQPALTAAAHCPEAEKAASEVISLPMHPYLASQDQDLVIERLLEVVEA